MTFFLIDSVALLLLEPADGSALSTTVPFLVAGSCQSGRPWVLPVRRELFLPTDRA